MWQLKTEEEINRDKKRQIGNPFGPLFITLLFTIIILVSEKIGFKGPYGPVEDIISWSEFIKILPRTMLISIGIFVLLYIIQCLKGSELLNESNTIVCMNCNKVKTDDGNLKCECGHSFINLSKVKWEERKNDYEWAKVNKEEKTTTNQFHKTERLKNASHLSIYEVNLLNLDFPFWDEDKNDNFMKDIAKLEQFSPNCLKCLELKREFINLVNTNNNNLDDNAYLYDRLIKHLKKDHKIKHSTTVINDICILTIITVIFIGYAVQKLILGIILSIPLTIIISSISTFLIKRSKNII